MFLICVIVCMPFCVFRQSVQCKEATPPALQSKKFARPPSCARRHLVFDNDTQFNSIDSGFVEEYILQPQPSDEQVHLRAWKLVEVIIHYSLGPFCTFR